MRLPILSTFLSLKISPSSHCKFLLGKKKKENNAIKKIIHSVAGRPLIEVLLPSGNPLETNKNVFCPRTET